jgi:hypothetical protein
MWRFLSGIKETPDDFIGFSNVNCMNSDSFIVLHKALKRFTDTKLTKKVRT